MKKIVYFGADFPPTGGGIATLSYDWILNTAEAEQVKVVRAIIFGNRQPRTERLSEKLAIETYRTKNFFWIGFLVLWHMLANFQSDIFHSLNLFPVGFWTVLWSKIFGRKSGLHFYGTDACGISRATTRKMKRWTIENASLAVTISNFTKNETAKILGIKRRIELIYPLLPLKSLERQRALVASNRKGESLIPGVEEGDFIVLSVCRMVPRKGLDLLIRAVSEINDEKIKLVLVGGGPEKDSLQKLASDLGVPKRVLFAGKIESLEAYYKKANVAVLLSYYIKEEGDFEGLGLVLLEAQNFGVPVIGSQSGGIPETFIDGESGILVNEKDISGIKSAIISFKENPDRTRKMGERGRQFVKERFDPKENIRQYIKLL